MNDTPGVDRDLVCVDLETTGGNAAWHRIIEIGTVEIDRDGAMREWSTLVNPGTLIPAQIEAFTGITNQMVAAAPRFEDVHRELLVRLAGRTFVAHNARFDYGFIRAELARLDIKFSARVLCTVKLSRRLFPGEPRHNLDAVMARHGLECSARHRALGDARVLGELLARWRRDVEPARLEAAVEALLRETPLPPQLPPTLADELPESVGVYRFFGQQGALLYVGKSKNIRARVLDHFAAEHRSLADERLAREVHRVGWTETAGELGALLLEATTVKAERPLHNRRLRTSSAACSLRLLAGGDAPDRVAIVALDGLDGAALEEVYGLYRDEHAAARALAEIVRAHRLCARVLGLEPVAGTEGGAGSCVAYQLGRCKGACIGAESAALHNARIRLALAGLRLTPWPYRGRVLLAERDWRGEEDLLVLDAWRYLGTVREPADADGLDADAVPFDPDIYRILKRYFATPAHARARARVREIR